MVVTHVFAVEGAHSVILTVMDNESRKAQVVRAVLVVAAIEPVELVPFESSAGFRIPVPRSWVLERDVTVGGVNVELQLFGPVTGLIRTNILVDTEPDPTVRENAAYLDAVMDEVVAEIRSGDPFAVVTEGPRHRMVAGHLSVTFVVEQSGSLTQRITLLVSEAHDRFWAFILTTDRGYFPVGNATLERMLDGFEITLAPADLGTPGLGTLALVAGIVAAVVGALLVVVLLIVRRTNRQKGIPSRVPAIAPPLPPMPPTPPMAPTEPTPPAAITPPTPVPTQAINFCPRCGTAAEGNNFCTNCGSPLRS